ncbi:hypothetical protein AAFF_G00005390 [Aldrovandia affinis]|uniref:SAC3/GANP/THP3 conserved domain-containing protein n=1 Tax=Aldrovandia affinis TaxID=143900 RepID=A0AAD7X3S7_9TELE|nr:hypothetical protein AAFF_G00005390 [Aldrovandia affinis]
MSRKANYRTGSHSRKRGGGRGGGGGGRAECREWRQEQHEEEQIRPEESGPRGTCMSMCPIREVREREAQRLLHRFEILPGTESDRLPRADPSRTVKEYSRPAAGKDSTRPCDLRPPSVLLKTMCFLIDDIATSPTLQPWTEGYDFVFDRLRCVRQDMVIQRVSGAECVAVLERTVRFLLYASYRLCEEPLRLYDPRINDTHLQESLSWLLDCYSSGEHRHLEEFQALSLLYNLGSSRALRCALELPERVRDSPKVRLALAVNRAHLERNPVRVLRLARGLDFLQSCALHRHLGACRQDLLLLYSHGHSSRNCRFPLQCLAGILALEEAPAARLCRAHGVAVNGDYVVFSKASYVEPPPGDLQSTRSPEMVDSKRGNSTVSEVIHGCA